MGLFSPILDNLKRPLKTAAETFGKRPNPALIRNVTVHPTGTEITVHTTRPVRPGEVISFHVPA